MERCDRFFQLDVGRLPPAEAPFRSSVIESPLPQLSTLTRGSPSKLRPPRTFRSHHRRLQVSRPELTAEARPRSPVVEPLPNLSRQLRRSWRPSKLPIAEDLFRSIRAPTSLTDLVGGGSEPDPRRRSFDGGHELERRELGEGVRRPDFEGGFGGSSDVSWKIGSSSVGGSDFGIVRRGGQLNLGKDQR
ncbi:uncharacterized protein A4U43_C04F21090 [Asparagus officinalis]|uniref:Uncharacterized protein n=1 Tax=Asparagus officinalis TaxID=4686 RepID=A0A5P1F7X9_ASPOF|nr:uncharacterized protein A4U43_C04F21090 [Asparagus officinalis]